MQLHQFLLTATNIQAQALLFAFDSLDIQFEQRPAPGNTSLQLFIIYTQGDHERDRALTLLSQLPHTSLHHAPFHYDRSIWVEKWKESFHWDKLSARLAVGPDFRPVPFKDVPHCLAIRPGQAFGTGVHETTRIALRLLDTYIFPKATVCDAGTGSGVLAVAAKLLGAGHTVGFDISPDAQEECQVNCANNGVSFDYLHGAGEDITGPFDIVVANMLAHELLPMAPLLRSWVAPAGLLILTGLIEENFPWFEYRFFDIPEPAAPSGWRSPTLSGDHQFRVLEKRWENEWWGGVWRREI